MTGPDAATAIANLAKVKQRLDLFFDRVEGVTPDALKDELEEARGIVDAAFASLNVAELQASFTAAIAVVKRGRGVSGGGYNAFLA